MSTIGTLAVNVLANTGQYAQGMQTARNENEKFRGSVGSVSTGLEGLRGLLAGLSVGAAFAGIMKLANMAGAAAREEAKLTAAVEASGRAAGFTAPQLSRFADELERMSTFDADDIRTAMAGLTVFTRLTGQAFQDVVRDGLGMTALMGGDMKANVLALGKALNDPEKGLKALRASGIAFSAEQTKVIKQLMATGQVAKAQAILLGELNKRFGGAAQADAQTYTGQVAQLKVQLENLGEKLGGAVLPMVAALTAGVAGLIDMLNGLDASAVQNIVQMTAFVGVFMAGLVIIPKVVAAIVGVIKILRALATASIVAQAASGVGLVKVLASVAAAGVAVGLVNTAFDSFDNSAAAAEASVANLAQAAKEDLPEALEASAVKVATVEKAFDKLRDRAKQLTTELRTPFEKAGDELAEVSNLAGRGLISLETYRRAVAKIGQEYLDATDDAKKLHDQERDRGTAALEKGTTAAFSAVQESRRELERQNNLAKDQLREQEETNRKLDELIAATHQVGDGLNPVVLHPVELK